MSDTDRRSANLSPQRQASPAAGESRVDREPAPADTAYDVGVANATAAAIAVGRGAHAEGVVSIGSQAATSVDLDAANGSESQNNGDEGGGTGVERSRTHSIVAGHAVGAGARATGTIILRTPGPTQVIATNVHAAPTVNVARGCLLAFVSFTAIVIMTFGAMFLRSPQSAVAIALVAGAFVLALLGRSGVANLFLEALRRQAPGAAGAFLPGKLTSPLGFLMLSAVPIGGLVYMAVSNGAPTLVNRGDLLPSPSMAAEISTLPNDSNPSTELSTRPSDPTPTTSCSYQYAFSDTPACGDRYCLRVISVNATTTVVGISRIDRMPFGDFGIQWVILASKAVVDQYAYALCGDRWTNQKEFVSSFPTARLGLSRGAVTTVEASLGVGPNQFDCRTNYITGASTISYVCK